MVNNEKVEFGMHGNYCYCESYVMTVIWAKSANNINVILPGFHFLGDRPLAPENDRPCASPSCKERYALSIITFKIHSTGAMT